MIKINQKFITSLFIFFIVFLLSISAILANNIFNEEKYKIDEEKIYYQIKYLDNEIIKISRLLNTNDSPIKWKELLNHANNLYNSWNSYILDLNNLNIDKKYLINFTKDLDQLIISIKDMNEKNVLIILSNLNYKLIMYINDLNYENYKNILIAKYNLISASLSVKNENWTLAHEYILKANNNVYQVFKKIDMNLYEQYNINQAYIAAKEMENIINIKDMDVFYIKYQIALDKLENL